MNPNVDKIKLSIDGKTLLNIAALDKNARLMWLDGLCAIAAGKENEFVFDDPSPFARVFWLDFSRKVILARNKYLQTCESNRGNVNKRWGKNKRSRSIEKSPNAAAPTLQLPPDPNAKKRSPAMSKRLEEFAHAIYQMYPRKQKPILAKKAILKTLIEFEKDGRPATELMEKTKAYAIAVAAWPDDAKKYIPHPTSWFNQGAYDDDPETWKRESDNGRVKPVYDENDGNF